MASKNLTKRTILPICSSESITRKEFSVTTKAARDFQPTRLIARNPHKFQIRSVAICGARQSIPRDYADRFSRTSPCRVPLGWDTIPAGGEITVDVSYQGQDGAGEPLEACLFGVENVVIGNAASDGRVEVMDSDVVRVIARCTMRDVWMRRLGGAIVALGATGA